MVASAVRPVLHTPIPEKENLALLYSIWALNDPKGALDPEALVRPSSPDTRADGSISRTSSDHGQYLLIRTYEEPHRCRESDRGEAI